MALRILRQAFQHGQRDALLAFAGNLTPNVFLVAFVAALMSNNYEILTVVLSFIFLGDSLNWKRISRMALTLTGVVCLAMPGA